ncbi:MULTISPECIES: tetratricopeptide repeat protein [unclassified Microcoleus]|uniref:tetratricopeptide repeat protein n=1 Tax=unclassified Microcoleus TaxID=2642155 RepID=UPI002FCF4546
MTTKSLADYDRAIQLNPNLAAAYSNRGAAKSAINDKQSAIEDYQKAADLYKQQGNTGIWYQRAVDNMKKLSKQ